MNYEIKMKLIVARRNWNAFKFSKYNSVIVDNSVSTVSDKGEPFMQEGLFK